MAEKVTLVFAQFGDRASVLEPSLSSFRRRFPEAAVILYSDQDARLPGIQTRVVGNPYGGPRAGNRGNDLYKVVGLLKVAEGVGIALDSDMEAVSDGVMSIVHMAEKFGLCVPCNPRRLVRVDNTMGADADGQFDESGGWGHAFNMSPVAFCSHNLLAMGVLQTYWHIMMSKPVRGPTAMWRACWERGFFPCLLPAQWCVCQEDCGVGNEIVLHVGHERVRNHYAGQLK